MKKANIILIIVLFYFFASSNLVKATRIYDEKLLPENIAIIDNGIKYIPNSYYDSTKGRTFYIEAWDIMSGKKLWEQKIYEIKYNLSLEQDVQDVFITSLRIEKGKLIIKNEKDEEYTLDLNTKEVEQNSASSSSCEDMYNEIENDLDKANFCEKDNDCEIMELGGEFIKFGCYHFINKSINKEEIYGRMSKYYQQCDKMINECSPSPAAVCVNKKCIKRDEK